MVLAKVNTYTAQGKKSKQCFIIRTKMMQWSFSKNWDFAYTHHGKQKATLLRQPFDNSVFTDQFTFSKLTAIFLFFEKYFMIIT